MMSFIAYLESIPIFWCVIFIPLALAATVWLYDRFFDKKSMLEISYDNGKYNSIEKVNNFDPYGRHEEVLSYRVKIYNNSKYPITGVEILIEGIPTGTCVPSRGRFIKFQDKTVYTCDINPKSYEIVAIGCLRGNLEEKSKAHEIIIRCSGKEAPEITKKIHI